MRKNSTDQKGAPGIWATALGYAMKARPGPGWENGSKVIGCLWEGFGITVAKSPAVCGRVLG